jgi:hypothetical protein
MNTTINPTKVCDYKEWSDICIKNIKKDLYSYFSHKYTKEDINCSLEKFNIEKIYKTPNEFYINSELFLFELKKHLNICRNKKIKIIETYLIFFFIIVLLILSIILIISYFKNNK